MTVLVEICVDDVAGIRAALKGGADRIELCSALDLGGLTPSAGLMRHAVATGLPVMAMIRPRAGDFVWSPDEIAVMQADIETARAAGVAGVVLGASRPDGRLDADVLGLLIGRAAGMVTTLHRCFDLTPDPVEALETAVDLGFRRILTSGQAQVANEGAGLLAALMGRAAGRIIIMPGAGIRAETVDGLRHLPLGEIHASCRSANAGAGRGILLGFSPAVEQRTDAARIRALRQALAG
jgi:copper homeostasis protein